MHDTLTSFVDEQVSQRGHGTSSESVRELIRKDHHRLHLHNLLLKGATSKSTTSADCTYFESLRRRVRSSPKPAGEVQTHHLASARQPECR